MGLGVFPKEVACKWGCKYLHQQESEWSETPLQETILLANTRKTFFLLCYVFLDDEWKGIEALIYSSFLVLGVDFVGGTCVNNLVSFLRFCLKIL